MATSIIEKSLASDVASLNDALANLTGQVAPSDQGTVFDICAALGNQSRLTMSNSSSSVASALGLPSIATYSVIELYKHTASYMIIICYPFAAASGGTGPDRRKPIRNSYINGAWSGWYDFAGTELS